MPAEALAVTPAVDTVCDRVAAQFPSGAFLTVDSAGVVELLPDSPQPTDAEVTCLVEFLQSVGDTTRAAGLQEWAA